MLALCCSLSITGHKYTPRRAVFCPYANPIPIFKCGVLGEYEQNAYQLLIFRRCAQAQCALMHNNPPSFPLQQARVWGIGVDLCQLGRVQAAYARQGERLVLRLLTPAEQRAFHTRWGELPARGLQYLASRFAAKEALAKALGTGIRGVMGFQAASILSDELGKPCVHPHGELTKMFESQGLRAHISLSDEEGWVIAYCLVEHIIQQTG